MSETTTSTTPGERLIDQITAEIADLTPTRRNAHMLVVQGLQLWYEPHGYGVRGGPLVRLRTGAARNHQRTLRNLDPAHIARQLRRILAEQAKARAEREVYRTEMAERQAREEAASADVQELIDAVNEANGRPYTGIVGKWSVEERYGEYRYDVALHGLTGEQLRAVLARLTPAAAEKEQAP